MSPLFILVPIRKKQDTNYNKTNPMKLKQTFTMLAAALALIVLGVLNGGLRDVLVKAVNLCTECIGLG